MNNVLKSFTKYVGLNIIGMISTAVCVFIDYLFVSMAMGTDGLAALGLGVPIFSVLFGFGLLLGIGGGAKYAMLRAQGKQDQANQMFSLTFKMGCIITIPFVMLGVFFATQIAALLGAGGHILPMTTIYIKVLLILSPGMILYSIFEAFARNDEAPKIAMISAVIFNAMNIIFDYVFIIVFSWGMFGAALASAVAAICALVYLLFYWLRKKMNFRLVKAKFIPKQMWSICEIGAPALINDLLYALILITFNLTLLSLIGNVGVAAFGIISSIALVVFFIFAGLGQGIQPLASHYYGTKDRKSLIKILKYSFITSTSVAVVAITIIFFFADSITSVLNYEQDMAVAELANEGIRIYFTAFLFVGITMVAIAFLSVTNMPKVAVILSILRGGAVLIPLILILSRIFGVTGVWAAYPIAEFILAIVSIFCLVWANRLYKKTFKI